MTQAVQIIGSGGMLGRFMARSARARGWQVYDTPVDITVVTGSDILCDLVVNCAAITDRKAPPCKTISINSLGPHVLAGVCDQVGARMVHISTDLVFQGDGPHVESEKPDATSFTALAKLFGEVTKGAHVTVRTSVVGLGLRGLVKDVLNATPITPLIASDRLKWNGVTSLQCAETVLDVAARRDIVGLLHIPGQYTTRWRLCKEVASWLGVDDHCLRQDDTFVADRRLASERWETLHLPVIPSIAEQLNKAEKPNGTDQYSHPSKL